MDKPYEIHITRFSEYDGARATSIFAYKSLAQAIEMARNLRAGSPSADTIDLWCLGRDENERPTRAAY